MDEKIGSITKRDHWEQIEKSTGFKHDLLNDQEVPECVIEVWKTFWELSRQRISIGGMGGELKPIKTKDIFNHSQVMKLYLLPTEVQMILDLDKVYLKHQRDGLSKS